MEVVASLGILTVNGDTYDITSFNYSHRGDKECYTFVGSITVQVHYMESHNLVNPGNDCYISLGNGFCNKVKLVSVTSYMPRSKESEIKFQSVN